MSKYIIIFCTIGTHDQAQKLAKPLVEKKLAACVNIIPGLTSIYKWKGELYNETECLMIIKTKKNLFEDIKTEILSLHPYDLPEIVSLPIDKGLPGYLDWIRNNTKA